MEGIVNPFTLVLIILPAATFVAGILLQLFIKRKLIVTALTFVAYLIATFTIFNDSFLIWCFVYSAIAFGGALLTDILKDLFAKKQ